MTLPQLVAQACACGEEHNMSRPTSFRFAQRSFGAKRWQPVAGLLTDAELASRGYALAGPGRDSSALSEAERDELWTCFSRRLAAKSYDPNDVSAAAVMAKEEKARDERRIGELLERCPYTAFVPPIDIDVCDESGAYVPERDKALSLEYARRLDRALEAAGLGRATWCRTNTRGGLHGGLLPPPDVSSVHLLHRYGRRIATLCRELGIPLYSSFTQAERDDKTNRRCSVYVDDSVYSRTARGRGVMWRLVGSRKPNGFPKTPMDLLGPDGPCLELDAGGAPEPEPGNREACRIDLAELEAEARKPEAAFRLKAAHNLTHHLPTVIQPPTSEDRAAVAANPELERLWNAPDPLKRRYWRRDVPFVEAALRCGLPEDQIARLLWVLPHSKRVLENRNEQYVASVFLSAVDRLAKARHSPFRHAPEAMSLDSLEARVLEILPPPREETVVDEAERAFAHEACAGDEVVPEPVSPREELRLTPKDREWIRTTVPDVKALANVHSAKDCWQITHFTRCEHDHPLYSGQMPCAYYSVCASCAGYELSLLRVSFKQKVWPDRVAICSLTYPRPPKSLWPVPRLHPYVYMRGPHPEKLGRELMLVVGEERDLPYLRHQDPKARVVSAREAQDMMLALRVATPRAVLAAIRAEDEKALRVLQPLIQLNACRRASSRSGKVVFPWPSAEDLDAIKLERRKAKGQKERPATCQVLVLGPDGHPRACGCRFVHDYAAPDGHLLAVGRTRPLRLKDAQRLLSSHEIAIKHHHPTPLHC